MKVSIEHADTCLPDYWSGLHRPHVQIPIYPGMTIKDVRRMIASEISMGAVMGSDKDASALSADMVDDETYVDELKRAVYAAIKRIKPAKRGQRAVFRDVESDGDVYAYFVIVVEGERQSLITFEGPIDARCRELDVATVARMRVSPGIYRYIVIGTEYGCVHTTGGDVRTWRSYSGARKFARTYEENRA